MNRKSALNGNHEEVNDEYGIFENEDAFFDEKVMLTSYNVEIPDENFCNNLHSYGSALNHWFDIPQDKLDIINSFVEHLGKQDKIDFNINFRLSNDPEGKHEKVQYNLSDAINGYYYSLLTMMENSTDLGNAEADRTMHAVFTDHIKMRAMDTYWREHITCPTVKEYIWKAKKDMTSKFIPALMLTFKPEKREEMSRISSIMCLLFAIYNDYKNILVEVRNTDPFYLGPIATGSFTFPVVHAVDKEDFDSHKIVEILRQKTTNTEVKKFFLEQLTESGSMEFTRNNIESLKNEALKEVAKIGENTLMETFIRQQFSVDIY